eukprot:6175514-Pleurochrysis_carterae.AAC.1
MRITLTLTSLSIDSEIRDRGAETSAGGRAPGIEHAKQTYVEGVDGDSGAKRSGSAAESEGGRQFRCVGGRGGIK